MEDPIEALRDLKDSLRKDLRQLALVSWLLLVIVVHSWRHEHWLLTAGWLILFTIQFGFYLVYGWLWWQCRKDLRAWEID